MPTLIFLSLLGYLGTLATLQTNYAWTFMTYRWIALITLVIVSGFHWMLFRPRRRLISADNTMDILMVYLFSTLLTVPFAENWVFSGMRWTSHAMMLLAFLLFLPPTLQLKDVQRLITVLKATVAVLLLVSWIYPVPWAFEDTQRFQGAMGDPNTMGHIAAMGALLYFHGAITTKEKRVRIGQGAIALGAMATVWFSGARSSMLALMVGLMLLGYVYRRRIGFKIIGTMLAVTLVSFAFPNLPGQAKQFILKGEGGTSSEISRRVIESRRPVWEEAWEGFKSRPLLGWGFGADSNVPVLWEIQMTALGTVERDAVNDFLFMLEGGGIVGLGAYLLLVYLILKQRPAAEQRAILMRFSGAPAELRDSSLPIHHAHAILFIVATSLLVLFQLDGTALSAGSFMSAALWLTVGGAIAIRKEVPASALAMRSAIGPSVSVGPASAKSRPRLGPLGKW